MQYVQGKVLDITQPSDHSIRRDRRMPDPMEQLLEDWSVWDATDVGLSTPCKTSLKVAEEMRPKKLANKPPKEGDKYTYRENGKIKLLPAWIRQIIYDIENMAKKTNVKSTRVAKSSDPLYHLHIRMSMVNRAIAQLHDENPYLWTIIILRYRDRLDWQTVNKEIGMPRNTYFNRLKKAKKRIHQIMSEY